MLWLPIKLRNRLTRIVKTGHGVGSSQMSSYDHPQKWSWWTKEFGDRKNCSLQVTLALCPTQGDNMRMRAEHRYVIPEDSVCLWCNRGMDSHPHLFEVPLKSLSDVQKQTYHASANRHFWNFSADGFILQDPLPLQYSKSRFPQLISLNGREAHNPKHSLPVYPQRLCNLASLQGHTFLNLGRESKTRLPMWVPNALRNPRYKVRLLRG